MSTRARKRLGRFHNGVNGAQRVFDVPPELVTSGMPYAKGQVL